MERGPSPAASLLSRSPTATPPAYQMLWLATPNRELSPRGGPAAHCLCHPRSFASLHMPPLSWLVDPPSEVTDSQLKLREDTPRLCACDFVLPPELNGGQNFRFHMVSRFYRPYWNQDEKMETVGQRNGSIQPILKSCQASQWALNALSARTCLNPDTGGGAMTPPTQFLPPGLFQQPPLTFHGILSPNTPAMHHAGIQTQLTGPDQHCLERASWAMLRAWIHIPALC